MQQIHCEMCNEISPTYDIIHVGSLESGYRTLCMRCFNAEAAKRYGLNNFENIQFDPIKIDDCNGEPHEFRIRTQLMGHCVSLEAIEIREGNRQGYEFQMTADPEEELFALLGLLILKIRRALAVNHIRDEEHGLQIADQTVRGRIAWDDDEEGRVPLVIVDGREYTWDQLGEMLMTFEGWQFKLEIVDASEEV